MEEVNKIIFNNQNINQLREFYKNLGLNDPSYTRMNKSTLIFDILQHIKVVFIPIGDNLPENTIKTITDDQLFSNISFLGMAKIIKLMNFNKKITLRNADEKRTYKTTIQLLDEIHSKNGKFVVQLISDKLKERKYNLDPTEFKNKYEEQKQEYDNEIEDNYNKMTDDDKDKLIEKLRELYNSKKINYTGHLPKILLENNPLFEYTTADIWNKYEHTIENTLSTANYYSMRGKGKIFIDAGIPPYSDLLNDGGVYHLPYVKYNNIKDLDNDALIYLYFLMLILDDNLYMFEEWTTNLTNKKHKLFNQYLLDLGDEINRRGEDNIKLLVSKKEVIKPVKEKFKKSYTPNPEGRKKTGGGTSEYIASATRGRPVKDKQFIPEQPKKRVGRPRIHPEPRMSDPMRFRGRPRTRPIYEEKQKKQRGRPPKNQTQQIEYLEPVIEQPIRFRPLTEEERMRLLEIDN